VNAYWRAAGEVCTVKEMRVLELADKHGLSQRMIAMSLGLSRSAVRERLENARRKIKVRLEEAA
jgi:predicted DNA-binding protein (UPF0251 family)